MNDDILLRVEGVEKNYPGVRALKGVTTSIRKGEVRAIIGENGAGKSTLIKCIMGVETLSKGKIEINIDGQWRAPHSAIDAKAMGMYANYQHVNIAKNLSIAENYYLGRWVKNRFGLVDWPRMNRQSQQVIDKFQLHVNATARICDLPVAMQAMITISKISVNDVIRLVIFDEPTALLENDKVEILFDFIRELKQQGIAVIYISHRLEEIIDICDTVTVLKDGAYIETRPVCDVDKEYLISKMVGRPMEDIYRIAHYSPGDELLRVDGISVPGRFRDMYFSLKAGEILGFFGLVGAGRSEVMRAIFGVEKITRGQVYIKGKPVKIRKPKDAMKLGIGFLTEDRRFDGLALELPMRVNVNMNSYDLISKAGIISLAKEGQRAEDYRQRIRIVTPSTQQLVSRLSGGNQQKVVIAKLLCREPDILIFDEPTVGVDVGAKEEIFQIIQSLTMQGKGIILISSYLPEAMGLSDRLVVMAEGRIMDTIDKEHLQHMTEEDILKIASMTSQSKLSTGVAS
jgi:ribose transport system ATP-binding protein